MAGTMEYEYLPNPPQPYTFIALPPTPAHQPALGDDYSTGSPPEPFEQHFQPFDTFTRYNTAPILAPSPRSPGVSFQFAANAEASFGLEVENEQMRRSSSEEKDNLTPAQTRRKAQNRAAQRAFRERKERRVRDLEVKLASFEQKANKLLADNERLKRELHKVVTENKMLRAPGRRRRSLVEAPTPDVPTMRYSPADFYSNMLLSLPTNGGRHRILASEARGGRLLAAGATWDLIQEHPLYKKGLVDVGNVCEQLKKIAQCDGQGPMFEEIDVKQAIEASAASGSDELI